MAHTFEMWDWRRLRGVKGLEATEPGAWAALHWAPPPFRVLGGRVLVPQGSSQRPGGKLGPEGSGEAEASESAWRERKQVAGATHPHTVPVPCLETFLRVGWPVPLDPGPGRSAEA